MKELSIHQNFKVGDKVCFSAEFLHSIGDYSAERANIIGEVKAVVNTAPARGLVEWTGCNDGGSLVLNCNLWPADKKHLEPR